MMKRRTTLTATLAGTLVVLAAVAGLADVADSAPQAPPSNQAPPAVSGTPEEGKTLTTSNGTWAGTAPITFAYSWRRCDEDGGSCSQIGGATDRTYVLRKVDIGNTLRSRVTARNADGSVAATSVPTAVIRAAPAPPPSATGCAGNAPLQVGNIALPDRLLVDGQSISPGVVGGSTRSVTIRAHVSCKGKAVQGARVYVSAVPFNQFTVGEGTTAADGWATVTMSRLRGFPASSRQQLLAVFIRAQQPGPTELGGISTRRLVSFPVDLSR